MRALLLLTIAFAPAHLAAQSQADTPSGQVEILNADEWLYGGSSGAQRLRGHVRFRHAGAVMQCDSAHLFPDQRVDAFSRVSIEQGDSLRADADLLRYNGQQRTASLDGQVRLRDGSMELTTASLDYDLRGKRATYLQGGRIVSTKDGNVLTSGTGTYLADQRRFIFGRNVLLEHPERRISTDTMHYGTGSGIAAFFGPTTITQGETVIATLGGTYDTRAERARFTRRTSVRSKGRLLEGDSLHYDRTNGIGLAWGHVAISDSSGDMRALGSEGRYNERTESSMVTGRAELQLRMGTDTLYLHGDTLFTMPDGTGRRVTARRHVRFFKRDLQGACDTLLFSDADSLIRMHHQPVLWNGADQITGDTIRIALKHGKAHRLHVRGNGFLLSRADTNRYDQVTGTVMTGYFVDDALDRLDVEGNARTVYFTREKKDDGEEVFGVNRADCSRIRVRMHEGAISAVIFLDQPDAVLYPIEKAPPEELLLKGAEDRSAERPVDRDGIFVR
ncbi:MAG TPA: OstA-like protein [Flavobacteriales bacterium]|nr:OstA-like protein [Flavobacteriales bacterium]